MAEQYKNFMGSFWFQREDNIYTVGFNEDALETFEKIESLELPTEGEVAEAEVVCGTMETDEGPIDIYAPVSGNVIEINNTVLEDPSLIQDDPYDAWLFKVESDEDYTEPDEDDEEDEDDEDEDDENEDDEEWEDEDEE
jgi:glycine cleavage system H protein